MAQKKLTKRQLLNEILATEEAFNKLRVSQERLDKRESRLMDKQDELAKELATVLKKEQAKRGEKEEWERPDPVVFKSHVIEVDYDSVAWRRPKCSVTSVKNVK